MHFRGEAGYEVQEPLFGLVTEFASVRSAHSQAFQFRRQFGSFSPEIHKVLRHHYVFPFEIVRLCIQTFLRAYRVP